MTRSTAVSEPSSFTYPQSEHDWEELRARLALQYPEDIVQSALLRLIFLQSKGRELQTEPLWLCRHVAAKLILTQRRKAASEQRRHEVDSWTPYEAPAPDGPVEASDLGREIVSRYGVPMTIDELDAMAAREVARRKRLAKRAKATERNRKSRQKKRISLAQAA